MLIIRQYSIFEIKECHIGEKNQQIAVEYVQKKEVETSFLITGSPWSFLSEACSFVLEEGNPLCRGYFLATRAKGEWGRKKPETNGFHSESTKLHCRVRKDHGKPVSSKFCFKLLHFCTSSERRKVEKMKRQLVKCSFPSLVMGNYFTNCLFHFLLWNCWEFPFLKRE